jgi:pyruvate/2-oxoglutarate dehydrogenase complex dihydrolipoamide dehydrogenase (E3) component
MSGLQDAQVSEGFVKVIVESGTGKILGEYLIGAESTSLI